MKYFLHLSYFGKRYRGWQSQAVVPSVQDELKDAISKLLREVTSIMGCGRTDAGVHALQYFLHFKSENPLPENFIYKLNRILPKDIVVHDIIDVPDNANVQRDAITRTYQYFLHTKKDPFINHCSSYYELAEIDLDKVKEGMHVLKTIKDFTSFCRTPEVYTNRECKLSKLEFIQHPTQSHRMKIVISADRFLRSMVRTITINLLDLGVGKLDINTFKSRVEEGKRMDNFSKAHPQGLLLTKVTYPHFDEIEVKTGIYPDYF